MKGFWKMTLAVICGIIICSILSVFIFAAMIGAMSGLPDSRIQIPHEGVLKIDMSKIELAEQAREFNPATLFNGNMSEMITTVGILDAVNAINAAASDPGVHYIYIRPEGMVTTSLSAVEEFRTALSNFRSSGKPIIAGMESPDNLSYYLGSVADKIYLSPYSGATYMLNGISGRLLHIKGLLDACGINVQLIRCGKYKSAGEMFISNTPSQENMEQNKAMVSSLWGTVTSAISQSRSITVDALNDAVDRLALQTPQDFVDLNLADELMTKEQLETKLADLDGKEKFSAVKFINFADYVKSKSAVNVKATQKMAIVYVDGQIMDGDNIQEVTGRRFANILTDVRKDTSIKAVVFRVNSPGGSVFASEQIKAEVDNLCKVKPVVASFGDYAASGGYWISNNCEKIFSDATTLTGSIGVFSIIPDFSSALKDKLHVGIYSVNSNKHSDMMECLRPFDKEELAVMQKFTDNIYDRFVSIVADGRDLEPDYVRTIAEGRVWTGSDAVGIGLVDEIGTLEDAAKWAAIAGSADASRSDLSNWRIESYPKPMTTLDYLMEMFGEQQTMANPLSGTRFEKIGASVLKWAASFDSSNKHESAYALMPYVDVQ